MDVMKASSSFRGGGGGLVGDDEVEGLDVGGKGERLREVAVGPDDTGYIAGWRKCAVEGQSPDNIVGVPHGEDVAALRNIGELECSVVVLNLNAGDFLLSTGEEEFNSAAVDCVSVFGGESAGDRVQSAKRQSNIRAASLLTLLDLDDNGIAAAEDVAGVNGQREGELLVRLERAHLLRLGGMRRRCTLPAEATRA